ncbi:hypothetical protein EON64_20930, partial [archaeon]
MMRYLKQFKEPLIMLLLGSACLSLLVGQVEDAVSIFFAVLLVGSVAAIQVCSSGACAVYAACPIYGVGSLQCGIWRPIAAGVMWFHSRIPAYLPPHPPIGISVGAGARGAAASG